MAEDRHPDGWTPEQINAVTDEFRAWLDRENPDLSRLMFNQDLGDLAMMAWPHAYRAGYEQGRAEMQEKVALLKFRIADLIDERHAAEDEGSEPDV